MEMQLTKHKELVTFSRLWTAYTRFSPKTQKQLETAAKELSRQLRKIGRVLVASSFRTVDAMWNNFEALAAHWKSGFDRGSPLYDGSLASQYRGLRKNCVLRSSFLI